MTQPQTNLVGANPIFINVEGAPVTIGQKLEIKDLIDRSTLDYIDIGDHDDLDDAIDALIGQQGVVEYLEYECGCGQIYPHEPMIGIKLDSGDKHEFWFEELKEVS